MKRLLILLLVIYTNQLIGQDLDQYLVLAAENNPGLKAKFNDYLASLEQIPQSKALPNPEVMFGYFVQPVETRLGPQRLSIGIKQSFPWFGSKKAIADVMAQRAEANLVGFENEKYLLYKKVRVTYDNIYFLQKSVHIMEDNLELLASFKELALVSFESGKTGFVNVLRVEMEEKEMQTRLEFLRDQEYVSFVEFQNLLNDQIDPIVFPDSLELKDLPYSVDALNDSIIENNIRLKELDAYAEAEDLQIRAIELDSRPSFSIGASYINIGERTDVDVPDNGRDAFLFPQIGFSLPIFKKNYQAMKKQSIIKKEGILLRKEDFSNKLESEMETYVRSYNDASRRYQLYQNLKMIAERSLALIQTEFITGKTDFEEVLRMERKLLNYQLELEKALVDNNDTVHNINYLLGL